MFALLLVGLLVAALVLSKQDLLRISVQPRKLAVVMAGAAVLALWWMAVVVTSYLAVRPRRLSTWRRITAGGVVAVLCLVVAAPFLVASRYAYVQRDLVNSVFPEAAPEARAAAGGGTLAARDPWAGQSRVNVLLLGGDGGFDRYGVRTDSMTLASVDTHTGRTVLLSLPRNLQRAPMPPGPMRERFPNGFRDLLNEVYQYVHDHPDMAPGVKGNRGATVLKAAISEILGVPVDYFVLVNLYGFADIVNALGGVQIRITSPIVYGLHNDVLKQGLHRLSGSQALWYGRSRTDSDDYTRMGRQRCLLGAIARQADPLRVLFRFQQLASATKSVVSTDIPRSRVPDFVDLAALAKDAKVTSVQFVPPLIKTYRPDWALIRATAAQAIADSEAGPAGETGGGTAGGTAGARAPGTAASPPASPAPSGHGKPAAVPAPVSLDNVCQYS